MDTEFSPERMVHLKAAKTLILQNHLDGKLTTTAEVLKLIVPVKPEDGWMIQDLIYLGAFCSEISLAQADIVSNAKIIAEKYNLTVEY